MRLFNLLFSSLSQLWYVEVRISRSISVSPLEFEITRVDCIFFSTGVFANYYCYNERYRETYYCEHGCCGDDWDAVCCSEAEGIVGIVVAIFTLVLIISTIISVICCCIKKKGRSGHVLRTTRAEMAPGQPSKNRSFVRGYVCTYCSQS